jgi:hypothetical protein
LKYLHDLKQNRYYQPLGSGRGAPHSRHLDPGNDLGGRLTGEAVRLIAAGIAKLEALDRGRAVRTLLVYDASRLDVGGDIARMLEE